MKKKKDKEKQKRKAKRAITHPRVQDENKRFKILMRCYIEKKKVVLKN